HRPTNPCSAESAALVALPRPIGASWTKCAAGSGRPHHTRALGRARPGPWRDGHRSLVFGGFCFGRVLVRRLVRLTIVCCWLRAGFCRCLALTVVFCELRVFVYGGFTRDFGGGHPRTKPAS